MILKFRCLSSRAVASLARRPDKPVNYPGERLGLAADIELFHEPFARAHRVVAPAEQLQHLRIDLFRRILRIDGSIWNSAPTEDSLDRGTATYEREYRAANANVLEQLRWYLGVRLRLQQHQGVRLARNEPSRVARNQRRDVLHDTGGNQTAQNIHVRDGGVARSPDQRQAQCTARYRASRNQALY